ncbi:hypothetical protein ETB97_007328 [Aspergillus alliaceus]|uniref:Cellulose-binding Sde182 nucleoside hydrolase-like domain-containing protein n=1 Tax=Petromyces alliaceus TaxID=209559 RepID=A0A8H5ZU88_PETAA|nr:hypothetical protein ETB97_007328 [Aspergillus burnettii]
MLFGYGMGIHAHIPFPTRITRVHGFGETGRVSSISLACITHHVNRYAVAAWGGISDDDYCHFTSFATKEVISAAFILESNFPSLLYMIPTGLSDSKHPEWGSWGGRYGPVAFGEGHFADSVGTVVDESGRMIMGSHVTVWRRQEASFQRDFAARMK